MAFAVKTAIIQTRVRISANQFRVCQEFWKVSLATLYKYHYRLIRHARIGFKLAACDCGEMRFRFLPGAGCVAEWTRRSLSTSDEKNLALHSLRHDPLQIQFLQILCRWIRGRLDVPQGAFGADMEHQG